MRRSLCLASFVFIVSSAASAEAQTVSWGTSSLFDYGVEPSAATNGVGSGYETELHMASWAGFPAAGAEMWFNTGTWSQALGGGNDFDAVGTWQSLAGDASSSSMLFTSAFSSWDTGGSGHSLINYRTGTLASNLAMSWNPEDDIDNGFFPSIAQASIAGYATQFIVFYNGHDDNDYPSAATNTLYYKTGTLNSDGTYITWKPLQTWANGSHASVTLTPIPNTPNVFFVAEAHQGSNGSSALWVDYGTLTAGSAQVNWLPESTQYDNGLSPSIAICRENGSTPTLVEVHNGGWGSSAGWYHAARILPCTVNGTWYPMCTAGSMGSSHPYDVGQTVYNPTVACTNFWGYETHQDAVGVSGLHETRFSIN